MEKVQDCGNSVISDVAPGKAIKTGKVGRPAGSTARSLNDEIALAEAKLKALRDRRREEERKDHERNLKVVLALLKDEGLDSVAAEQWKASMPKLRELLGVASSSRAKA